MTEEQIKLLCKLAVDNSKKPLTDAEKEVLKHAIDESKTVDDLFTVAMTKLLIWILMEIIMASIVDNRSKTMLDWRYTHKPLFFTFT